VTGGEELARTLEKVVSQLDIISRTLQVLEQRVSSNETSVGEVVQFYREFREDQQRSADEILAYNSDNLVSGMR